MKLNKLIVAAAITIFCSNLCTAQKSLDLEDVLSGKLIRTKGVGAMNWMKDGERYSRLEPNKEEGGMDVVAYRAKDNAREVIIPSAMFTDKSTGKKIAMGRISWSDDNDKVLIYNNTQRVWRYDTRGDYWVLSLHDGNLRQLGKGLPESSMMFAKFSPDGTRVAYVSNNNIYVEDINSGKITQLTSDGSKTIVNGTFDWVYEEEFSCRDGFRWSPDGKYIAYWQSDTEGTGVFDIINNVDSIYPTILHFPYPKAGTANSAVKVGYIPAAGGTTTWIDIPGDPRNNYIPRMDFIPESNELFIQQLNREQNTNKVWIAQIGSATPKNIFTDKDAAWLDTNDNILWLKNNRYFTWESERSGWRHLYRVSRDGKEIVPVTKGDFDYIQPVGTDLQKGLVYFIASPENYTQRYLYSANLFGKGEVKRLSPENQPGQHRYNMSPTGKWAVHTYSNSVTPPVTDMVSFPKNQSVRILEDNAEAKKQYDALGLNPKEFVKARSGDLLLDVCMIKPVNFDPSKKYPVIIDNMMNLEMLFRATQLTGDSIYWNVAVNHANTTLKNHFRPDYSSYHVVDYHPETGEVRLKCTHQGNSDDSFWSRGQAWGMYGFAMCYRFTKDPAYLKQSEGIADFFLNLPNMPADGVPYWDMKMDVIKDCTPDNINPDVPRDASAAALIASGLYELCTYVAPEKGKQYRAVADKIVDSLNKHYRAEPGTHYGFLLLHSTGHHPGGSEIDVPLNYADYFYLEALARKEALDMK